MIELKPCPSCGGKAHENVDLTPVGVCGGRLTALIMCEKCGTYKSASFTFGSKTAFDDVLAVFAEAVTAWNRRDDNEDYTKLCEALRCTEDGCMSDGMGCPRLKCKYRDVDGACDIVKMCYDSAYAIESLIGKNAEKDKCIAELDTEYARLMQAAKAMAEVIAIRIGERKCFLCKKIPNNMRQCELNEGECLFEFIDEYVAGKVLQVPNWSSCEGGEKEN